MPGRRVLERMPQLCRRSWEDVAPELELFLKRLWESESSGLPAGAGVTTPSTIEAGDVGSTGTQTLGWAPIDHEHPVPTGIPSGLANTNQEGSSPVLPRLDHKHKRDVRVLKAHSDAGTRNALDLLDSPTVTFTVVDNGGSDRVEVTGTVPPGVVIPAPIYRRWAFMFGGR